MSTEEVASTVFDLFRDLKQPQDLISHLPQIVILIYDVIHGPRAVSPFSELILKFADFWELILFEMPGLGANYDLILRTHCVAGLLKQLCVGEVDKLRLLAEHYCRG